MDRNFFALTKMQQRIWFFSFILLSKLEVKVTYHVAKHCLDILLSEGLTDAAAATSVERSEAVRVSFLARWGQVERI